MGRLRCNQSRGSAIKATLLNPLRSPVRKRTDSQIILGPPELDPRKVAGQVSYWPIFFLLVTVPEVFAKVNLAYFFFSFLK